MITLNTVRELAEDAHSGQADKLGDPYIWHVRDVAAGLRPLGLHLEMAGWLHDIIEDTGWTGERLLAIGVPDPVVRTVVAVTNEPGETYQEKIEKITSSEDATLVKIADNAHNTRPDRMARLSRDVHGRLAKKYSKAQKTLWAAADPTATRQILESVNPDLITSFHQWLWKRLPG